jgi:Short C-terminal domain
MTEASSPPAAADTVPRPRASRWRLIAARALTVVAVLLALVSVLANYVKREALDESQFRDTSSSLIANPTIRDQLAAAIVDTLYANVDVSAALQQRLPPNLQPLAGPIAGAVRDVADRSARRLLEGPRVQDSFVEAASAAQRQFIAVLDDDKTVLRTTNGKVVLDIRPLVLDLGDRFSFMPDLASRIPEGKAQVTILESDQLKTGQDVTKLLRFVADWIWILALAAAAAAVWLARGRRRLELRAIAIGLLIMGFLILIVRTLAGRYLVNQLVATDSVRPAAAESYDILTRLLRGDGWTAIIIALVALVGIWLSGPKPRATAARRALAPYLRRPAIAYTAVIVAYLLLLWWRPTPQFGFPRTAIVWFLLALLGLEVLRRQAVREFPDAEPKDLLASGRAAVGRRRRPTAESTAAQLEQLAQLHADGTLDDTEFAEAKAQLLGPTKTT